MTNYFFFFFWWKFNRSICFSTCAPNLTRDVEIHKINWKKYTREYYINFFFWFNINPAVCSEFHIFDSSKSRAKLENYAQLIIYYECACVCVFVYYMNRYAFISRFFLKDTKWLIIMKFINIGEKNEETHVAKETKKFNFMLIWNNQRHEI